MPQRKSFIILDIDGVLLEAHGYRMACIDTINDFLRQMGQPFLQIDRTITDAFEASGIACEWDMVPLALASFVNWYMELTDAEPEAKNYYPDCDETVICDNAAFNDMLMKKIAYFSSLIDPAETAINGIYNALLKSDGKGLEKLWKTPFRSHFFVDTLNSRKSPSFAQLMNRLLGSDEFTGFYGFDAPISVESYLETKDRILISEQYRKKLQNTAGENIYPAVMTYRPSGFPAGVGNIGRNNDVNTPEGECALRLLEWDHGRVPMIGAGSLCYIEEKYDLRREYYVKPHPFHALASMLAGISHDEIWALETARILCEMDPSRIEDPLTGSFAKDDELLMCVFEDSASGIESTKNAAEVLKKWGYRPRIILNGIRSTEAKNKLLLKTGASLYPDINAALDNVFNEIDNDRREYV